MEGSESGLTALQCDALVSLDGLPTAWAQPSESEGGGRGGAVGKVVKVVAVDGRATWDHSAQFMGQSNTTCFTFCGWLWLGRVE